MREPACLSETVRKKEYLEQLCADLALITKPYKGTLVSTPLLRELELRIQRILDRYLIEGKFNEPMVVSLELAGNSLDVYFFKPEFSSLN